MIINILAGGPVNELPSLHLCDDSNTIWVGVDRGTFKLLSEGITPTIAFGDFDSVSEEEFNLIKDEVQQIKMFDEAKDETDIELAFNWAVKQKPDKIRIFGATGGRLDHFFASVQLLLKPMLVPSSTEIEIIDRKNLIRIVHPGEYKLERIATKKYISFIPVNGDVSGLTLTGFKYPLKDRYVPISSTLCISNELIHEFGTFSFIKGILLVIRSSDE